MEKYITNELRTKIFKPLVDQIKYHSTGMKKFAVFDYEASLGKTYNYCKALVERYNTESNEYLFGNAKNRFKDNPKALIVIKTMREGLEVESILNTFDNDYKHKKDYPKFAIAVNSISSVLDGRKYDKYDLEQAEELKKYPAVIITQAMYLQLCKNVQLGSNLYGDRGILIIDEEVDFVYATFVSITVSRIALVEEKYLMYSKNCQNLFKNMVQDIRIELACKNDQMKRVVLAIDKEKLNGMIKNFENQLNIEVTEKFVKFLSIKTNLVKEDDDIENVKKLIMDEVNITTKFYNDENVISYKNGLYRYDPQIKPFMLKNNIWIDASANFNYLYKLDKGLFTLNKSERIIDHSNSTLFIDEDTYSTTSGKERKYIDLERDVLKNIQTNLKENDNVLIIDNKDNCKHIKDLIMINDEFAVLKNLNDYSDIDEPDNDNDDEPKPIDVVNFFAMRGRNKWGNYNKCYIIQQPQLIFPYYVFLYEYWTKENLQDIEIFLNNYVDKETGYSTFGFTLPNKLDKKEIEYSDTEIRRNKELEHLRQTSQLSSIYQGLKRIQRNEKPKGEFYVITTDEKINILLIQQLKGIKYKYYKFDIELKNPKQASNNAVKRVYNWISEADEMCSISLEKLAEICDTTIENIKKIFQREGRKLLPRISQKKIFIYAEDKLISYLVQLKAGESIDKNEFEGTYNVKWDNFKRSKYGRKLIVFKKIKIVNGRITINL